MVTNYNDLVRNEISKSFEEENEIVEANVIEFFYALTEEEQKTALRIALADLYKLTYYVDGKVSDLFKLPINQIMDRCLEDAGLVVSVLESSRLFHSMDFVSKALLIETMQDNDLDRDLYQICNSHILDKITYTLIDDLEKYKDYYKEYVSTNKDKRDASTTIVEYIGYRMINLKFNDEIKYKKYMLEYIKQYYKWKNFVVKNISKDSINAKDKIYLDIIESKSIEDIIKYIEDDFDFLAAIIDGYLYIQTQVSNSNKTLIEDYFTSNIDEKIKEKLKIKDQE